jgi:hypothetical protein
VVDTLRRLGYTRAADEALRVLPDQIDLKQLQEFGDQHGIPRDELIDRMGAARKRVNPSGPPPRSWLSSRTGGTAGRLTAAR